MALHCCFHINLDSVNGLSIVRCQAITWTNADFVNYILGNTYQWCLIWNWNFFIQENALKNVINVISQSPLHVFISEKEKPVSEGDDEEDSADGKSAAFTVLLHGSLKVENMVAITQVAWVLRSPGWDGNPYGADIKPKGVNP